MLYNSIVFLLRLRFKILSTFSTTKAASVAFDLFSKPFVRVKRSLTEPIFKQAVAMDRQSGGLFIKGFKWVGTTNRKALLVHGFQGDSGSLARFYTTPLLEKGYTVLAFDAPAHGLSEGNRSNIIQYANLIKEILADNPEVEIVIAHSFGCPCTAYALEQIGTAHQRIKVAMIAPAPKAKSQLLKFAGILGLSNKVIEEMYAIALKKGGKPIEWFSLNRFISSLNAEILIIHDQKDDICPFEDSLEIANAHYANISFVPTIGLGHSQIYKEESTVSTVMEYFGAIRLK